MLNVSQTVQSLPFCTLHLLRFVLNSWLKDIVGQWCFPSIFLSKRTIASFILRPQMTDYCSQQTQNIMERIDWEWTKFRLPSSLSFFFSKTPHMYNEEPECGLTPNTLVPSSRTEFSVQSHKYPCLVPTSSSSLSAVQSWGESLFIVAIVKFIGLFYFLSLSIKACFELEAYKFFYKTTHEMTAHKENRNNLWKWWQCQVD